MWITMLRPCFVLAAAGCKEMEEDSAGQDEDEVRPAGTRESKRVAPGSGTPCMNLA
jgi:hypothetical protein